MIDGRDVDRKLIEAVEYVLDRRLVEDVQIVIRGFGRMSSFRAQKELDSNLKAIEEFVKSGRYRDAKTILKKGYIEALLDALAEIENK